MFRPAYIYEDRPEDDDQDGPIQWSNRNGININYIDSRWNNAPRPNPPRFPRPDDLDFDHPMPGRRLYREYRHITVPRDQPRPRPPRFDFPNLTRPSRRYDPCTTHSLPRRRRTDPVDDPQPITVLLPGGDQAVIDLDLLNHYYPNASHFIVNQILDIPAYLRDQHRSGPEAGLRSLQDELRVVAHHIFTMFNEHIDSVYEDTFDEFRNLLYRGGEDARTAVLGAFAMCCLFDQRRSLGCAEELGTELMRFLEEAILIMARYDGGEIWVLNLFNGATRVMVEESRQQEEMLRRIWRGLQEVNGWYADYVVMTYRQADARGGIEGVRARRVLAIILQ